jgi:hypothetical protein
LDILSFNYLDANGNTAATLQSIREIQINIRVKTAQSDPSYTANGGFRTYTLTSMVTPRNLAY